MGKINIDNLFYMLECDNSLDIQDKGLKIASEVKHLSIFLRPIENKNVWENCAKVLTSKSNNELERYILFMFEWLQDMNWPGADIIYNRLLDFTIEEIEMCYRFSLNKARQTDDYPWYNCLLNFWKDYSNLNQ